MARKTLIQMRRDTAANWTSANPTLSAGEPGFETDTGSLKIGDGSTAWNSLGYIGGTPPDADDWLPWLVYVPAESPASTSGTWVQALSTAHRFFSGIDNSSAANTDYITWDVTLAAGTWALDFYYQKGNNRGIATITIGAVSVGTIDTYNGTTQNDILSSLTGISIASTGKYSLKVATATKNGASSGFLVAFFGIVLRRTA